MAANNPVTPSEPRVRRQRIDPNISREGGITVTDTSVSWLNPNPPGMGNPASTRSRPSQWGPVPPGSTISLSDMATNILNSTTGPVDRDYELALRVLRDNGQQSSTNREVNIRRARQIMDSSLMELEDL